MSYLALKHLHIACVALSGLGFLWRGNLMAAGSAALQSLPARVLPHLIDTVLLGSAIALAWQSRQYPLAQGWLTAKVIGLIAYIGLGSMALKRGRTIAIRKRYFWAALGVYLYIIGVALTKSAVLVG